MVYRNRSRNRALSALPSLELTAFWNYRLASDCTSARQDTVLTEHVWWSNATAFFCGIAKCSGGGSFCRNFNRAVGLPRGAKEGLKDPGEGDPGDPEDVCCPRLEGLDESSVPSAAEELAVCGAQVSLTPEDTHLRGIRRGANPQIRRPPWNARRYLRYLWAIPLAKNAKARESTLGRLTGETEC
jgi:hypothetical protein